MVFGKMGCKHTHTRNVLSLNTRIRRFTGKNVFFGRRRRRSRYTPPTPNCGPPGTVVGSSVTTTTTNQGGVATYTCYSTHQHMSGNLKRTCQSNSQWSGVEPVCAYMKSCDSSPCLNGGRCSNIPESYTCDCPEIWKGSRCENVAHVCARNPCVNYEECEDGADMYTCICLPGWSGQDCDIPVECGRPQGVTDGTVWYTGTTLNGVATYVCNEDFNMTSGDRVRTCMASGVWSGTKPTCQFVASCKSSPCHNEGSCVNKVEDFECHCSSGWDGKTCEEDVQPPILENCSANLIVNATEKTKLVVWAEPVFSDPMNSELRLSSNYESPQSVFPWGDFTITYAATKIKNGLCTECTFNISVRPTPCEPLKQPENGALLCNGWDNAYGTFCLVGCRSNFTIHPPNRYGNWLICGASGNWSSQAPDCSLNMEKEGDILAFHPSYTDFSFDECHNTTKLRQIFISEMTSHPDLSEFCQLYQACNDVNQVNVLC
ncbi:protein jagged-1b-like [Mya arenaria]|uniref:protein jagged-1b-like n=1 Tax=Mya arenaria TaxID=6604 RepID=UPI0022DF5432|nr:protein jagged-1b-like [Mya arenaria]